MVNVDLIWVMEKGLRSNKNDPNPIKTPFIYLYRDCHNKKQGSNNSQEYR